MRSSGKRSRPNAAPARRSRSRGATYPKTEPEPAGRRLGRVVTASERPHAAERGRRMSKKKPRASRPRKRAAGRVRPVSWSEFGKKKTIEELAAEQGVDTTDQFNALLGK